MLARRSSLEATAIKKSSMEVVHVVRQYKPMVGGLEDTVYNLCVNLVKHHDIKVRVITLDRLFLAPDKKLPRHEILDGIPVTRISYFGSSRYPIAPQVLREICTASLVHVHAIDFFFDYLALTSVLHRKPLVASTHGGFFHTTFASRLKKFYFQTMTRLSGRCYRALCASSENDATAFRRIASTKVVTIENGVDIDKWRNCASLAPLRTMIFVGRWSANKAVTVLIDLIAALKTRGAIWSLIIVGIPDKETETSLRPYVEQLDVTQHVRVRARPNEAEIATLIGEASYIASASRYEGFGISIIEGMSAGLIPLLSPIPPFQKLHKELGLGVVIDESNLDQSARNIEQAHAILETSTEDLRERCMICASKYDWAKTTDRIVEVYRKALDNVSDR
jgi:alpha-1,3-mannosyltransferase